MAMHCRTCKRERRWIRTELGGYYEPCVDHADPDTEPSPHDLMMMRAAAFLDNRLTGSEALIAIGVMTGFAESELHRASQAKGLLPTGSMRIV